MKTFTQNLAELMLAYNATLTFEHIDGDASETMRFVTGDGVVLLELCSSIDADAVEPTDIDREVLHRVFSRMYNET